MPERVTINVREDRKCDECGAKFAADNGLCLKCTGKALGPKPMKSKTGLAAQARYKKMLRGQ